MALSICKRNNSKKSPPPSYRRATIDSAPTGAAFAAQCLKQKFRRRPSLPLPKKSVQFSELSQLCLIDRRQLQGTARRWYTGEDHQRFKRERMSDAVSFRLEQLRQRETPKDQSSQTTTQPPSSLRDDSPVASEAGSRCPVGMEQLLSNKSMIAAHSNRKNVVRSILVEQHRQKSFGFRDPDSIAVLSVRLSADALERAVKRGMFQEMATFV
mmetsp:Transcript_22016/g.53281  ORF Transcript_22016/g.53281 Transcript_22016/m.53281 type:complete len:212 (+) Transcript_22016:50-685(+)|eukprot:CAMPEP_0181116736 /NCGR_PEP_ID=MMETSP1071-20121207/22116_1 /TAXON_ID=35127 /ORGANISM="Thalassiosira sp., Strain NH16" /LENGTH=211 /DNA_ID=CAMNT_0023201013 /DNA_START=26 /DNA_END=661 /DNA_ORIENTATION=-